MTSKTLTLTDTNALKIIIGFYTPSRNTKNIVEIKPNGESVKQTVLSNDLDTTSLQHEKSRNYFTLQDSKKYTHKLWLSSLTDHKKRKGIVNDVERYPTSTNLPCWWCRNKFANSQLGCPLKCLVTDGSCKIYFCEGLFCSFPCVKSYITSLDFSKGSSLKYKNSIGLLSDIYLTIKGTNPIFQEKGITNAPDWRLLKEYGGHLNIEEYRETFNRLEYTITPNSKSTSNKEVFIYTPTLVSETKL